MFYLLKVAPDYTSFKSITKWREGDIITEVHARNAWSRVEKWIIAYRDATDRNKYAFEDVETSFALIKREDLVRPAGGALRKERMYQLSYYLDIFDSRLAGEFREVWWNGLTTDSDVFYSISDL